MRNLSYENEFCVQFHFPANQSHFHKNGLALRLALKQRHKGTRKWPIVLFYRTLADKARRDVLRSSTVRYRPTNRDLVADLSEFTASPRVAAGYGYT